MLNAALLTATKTGCRKVVSLLVKYGANNYEECIAATLQSNHISAFLYLCKAIVNEDVEAIDILLARNDESVEELARYQDLMVYRLILAPLLQNGKVNLVVPIQVALSAGKLSVAGQIVQHSSHHPSTGFIDWHDLELNHIEPSWLQISGINGLTYLGLSSNKLRALPDQIARFNNLQKLQIHHNRLTYLPGEILQMPRIKHIDASFNNIATLPEVLVHPVTQTLESFNLSNNKLMNLPQYLENTSIKSFDISSNRFHKVPECIFNMRRLHTLNLSHNIGIEVMPYEIGFLRNLMLLGVDGLPYIKNLPSKEKMPPLEFLHSRARAIQTITHYDVAVVGSNEKYNACLETIYSSILEQSKRRHFSCLKFCNTEQFLHFQRFFALSCTVYVVVWDCQNRQPVDDLLHHVLHLLLYAPQSPIIITACWIAAITPILEDWVEGEIEKSLWSEFRDRITFITLTLDQAALVNRFNTLFYLNDIIDNKGKSRQTKILVPNSYFVLTDLINQEAKTLKDDGKPPFISEWDMWELIRSSTHHDFAGYKELSLAISFLTSVGSLLVLPSNQSNQSTHYVLNRQWFIDAVSGLLNRHQNLSDPSGLYLTLYLCDLLSCPTLQAPLPYALCHFASQMGLAIAVTSQQVLIPIMLPSHNTASIADFSSQYKIRRVYTFSCTPVAFWGRLIAHLLINMKHLLANTSVDSAGELVDGFRILAKTLPEDQGNWHYWKEGMIVWIGGSTLVYSVQAILPINEPTYREGLEVCVANTEIGVRAMNIISATVNTLLQNWYPELWENVEVSVPCPHCYQRTSYPTLFSFEKCCCILAKNSSVTCSSDGNVLVANDIIPDLARPAGIDEINFVSIDKLSVNVDEKSSCLSPPPLETVFRGEFGTTVIALKPFPPPTKSQSFLRFWHEFTILRHISHGERSPYLIELLMVTVDPLALVFPCALFCSMEEVVLERDITLLPLLRVRIVFQLASALNALHNMKVIHRNICLANILVYSLSLDDQINIKVGGFSKSCLLLNQGLAVGEYGTFPAPEMGKYCCYEYDERVDVFAFAFTAYEILSRKKLHFRRGVRFQTASGHSDRPPLNPLGELSPYFGPLLEQCWDNNTNKRPFFGEIVRSFQSPLRVLTREGQCINEAHEFNASAVRFTRQPNGLFAADLYICSSILSTKDSTVLSHISVPGLTLKESTALPSQYIICMCCSTDYLWVSLQHKFVRVYSTTTLEFIKEIRFDSHVMSMAVSPDSVYLGKEDGEIHRYNLSQPSPLHSPCKTRVIAYQQSIKVLQVLDDCVICCTKRSCIRIHPNTLLPEQEFPTVSETEIKCAAVAIKCDTDEEYLWVGFRRMQQIVVFNAVSGKAIYGINCCEVLRLVRSQVWVTCLLVVLDTVWVGLNTGHILSFSAFADHPHLLTYFKVHTDNVRCLMLLQPSYWGPSSVYQFRDSHISSSSSDEENSSSYSLPSNSIPLPRVVSVLSCGQGIDKTIPKIGSDGAVLRTQTDDVTGLHVVRLDGPDSSGSRKLECQARRHFTMYMDGHSSEFEGSSVSQECIYANTHNESFSSSPESHRTLPEIPLVPSLPRDLQKLSGEYNSIKSTPGDDPELADWLCVSLTDIPPPLPPRGQTITTIKKSSVSESSFTPNTHTKERTPPVKAKHHHNKQSSPNNLDNGEKSPTLPVTRDDDNISSPIINDSDSDDEPYIQMKPSRRSTFSVGPPSSAAAAPIKRHSQQLFPPMVCPAVCEHIPVCHCPFK